MILIIFLLWSVAQANPNPNSVLTISSGPCESSERQNSQGIFISENGRTFLVSSDLFVWADNSTKVCHWAKPPGSLPVKLSLVRKDSRRGLALFEIESPIPNATTFSPAKSVDRRSIVYWSKAPVSEGQLENARLEQAPLEVLQVRSERTFFPKGQYSIEAKAGLPSEALGAPVVNSQTEIVGVISRYHLIFTPGAMTQVRKISEDQVYRNPIVIPWSTVQNWIATTIAGNHPSDPLVENSKEKIKVFFEGVTFSEKCSYFSAPPKESPIGGFDGYGIGGFDGHEIGGLKEPATLCYLEFVVGPMPAVQTWTKQIFDRYQIGEKLRVFGVKRVLRETGEWTLMSVASVDHLFRLLEDPANQIMVGREQNSAGTRPIEVRARNWVDDFSRRLDYQHKTNTDAIGASPKLMFWLNQLRFLTLTLLSPFPEDIPMSQWNTIMKMPQDHPAITEISYLLAYSKFEHQEFLKSFDAIWTVP